MPKKRDPDSTALDKGFKLFFTLLTSGQRWYLTELAEALNCSKQTVLNLSYAITATGWGLIQSEINPENKQRYFYMERPGRTLPLHFTKECLSSLELCLSISKKIMPENLKNELEKFKLILANYMPPKTATQVAPALTLNKGHIDYTPFENTFKIMLEAINNQHTVAVNYCSNINNKARTFIYAPKGIMNYHEAIYITGWEVEKRTVLETIQERTLALQRIESVDIDGHHTTINIKMPKELEDGSFGVMEDETFNMTARFSAQVATYIHERQWSEGQKIERNQEDGSLTLNMCCRSTPETISWILGFGPDVQVLSPKWLVKAIKKQLALARAVYEGDGQRNEG